MQHCHEELRIPKNIWFCSTGEIAQHTNIYKPTFLHKYLLSGRHICPHMCLCGFGGREREIFTWKEEIHGLVDINVQIDV